MNPKYPVNRPIWPDPRLGLSLSALACAMSLTPAIVQAQRLDCMIQPSQVALVGSGVAGVVEHIAVDRGDIVTRGQVLAKLSANVERAALAVARERASQIGETVVARSVQKLAKNELERASEMYAQNFVSKTFLEKQAAETESAGGRTQQASERSRLANLEVDLARAQLAQRTVRSPLTGVVVERFASPGELLDQKPLLRIASIDPLRVDVLVPAAAFGQIEVGRRANVEPELFGHGIRIAVVKTVDRVVDAASNTFRVRLELPNPNGGLPAGLRCKIDLAPKLPEANRGTLPAEAERAATAQPIGTKPVLDSGHALAPGQETKPLAATSSSKPAASESMTTLLR